MKIGSVSNVNAFKGVQETSAVTSPNEKKDIKEVLQENKGKIALGLSDLLQSELRLLLFQEEKSFLPNSVLMTLKR